MKFIISQLTYFIQASDTKRNLKSLGKYLAFLAGVVCIYAVIFHLLMIHVEKQSHSWLTGFYWALTVMSTLGFGDITFHSDIGRLFSIVVLLSGVVLLLIVLPFAFIQFFYASWIETQTRLRAPRFLPDNVKGHVIICRRESIAQGLIGNLKYAGIPYYFIESDPVVAANMISDGLSVVTGEIDNSDTYDRMRISASRLVFANHEDTVNCNITLTIRQINQSVPIVATAEEWDSVDILELSGATHVLALKHKLGEQLAQRVDVGANTAHVVGRFRDILIAEIVVHDTLLAGKSLKESGLRSQVGVNVVAVWERGKLLPIRPDLILSKTSVPIVVGTREQLDRLNTMLTSRTFSEQPVLIIGGGKVGRAAAVSLKKRGVPIKIVERKVLKTHFGVEPGEITVGNAADKEVLYNAGLKKTSSVILSTSNDSVNIYLAVYCRRLMPKINIISRVTHERNVGAIYRAGADFVLSYASLGKEHVFSLVIGREPIMVGEGADVFVDRVPLSLEGKSIEESQIGERTGLIVIAIEADEKTNTNPPPATLLPKGGNLLTLGTPLQRKSFREIFG